MKLPGIVLLSGPIRTPWEKYNVRLLIFTWKMCILTDLTDIYIPEYFQSDLHIFWFDFMFAKLHNVPSMFCFNVQTDMRFLLQQCEDST